MREEVDSHRAATTTAKETLKLVELAAVRVCNRLKAELMHCHHARIRATGNARTHAGVQVEGIGHICPQLTCADGSLLLVKQLTVPGKKPCDAKAFWNGLNDREARWVGGDEVEPAAAS